MVRLVNSSQGEPKPSRGKFRPAIKAIGYLKIEPRRAWPYLVLQSNHFLSKSFYECHEIRSFGHIEPKWASADQFLTTDAQILDLRLNELGLRG